MSVQNDFEIALTVKQLLEESPDFNRYLSIRSKRVVLNEAMNEDPNKAPWAGVYFRGSRIAANTLPRGFKDVSTITIVLQASSTDPAKCFEKMAAMVKEAKQLMIDNRTIRAKIDQLTGDITTDYTYVETERETTYFQIATIEIQTEARANAAR